MNDIFVILAMFATYRISDILVATSGDRGPWDIIFKLHKTVGIKWDKDMDVPSVYPNRFLPQLLSCVGCTSVWVGATVTLMYLYLPTLYFLLIVMPFGLSGAAVLIDSIRYKG